MLNAIAGHYNYWLVVVLIMVGLYMVEANEAAVLNVFGKYVGTVKHNALRWHNPAVELRPLRRAGGTAAEVLHADAAALGADLMVMGGYSHSRLREVVFGGFTRHTLASGGDIAVLMAH